MNKHLGSDFDDFLDEDGLREEAMAAAVKRVIAWQIAQSLKAQKSHQDRDGRAHAYESHGREPLARREGHQRYSGNAGPCQCSVGNVAAFRAGYGGGGLTWLRCGQERRP